MSKIAIIDYGMGNLESVVNAIQRLNEQCIVTTKPKDLENVAGIILPGVGSFYQGMQNLRLSGFDQELHNQIVFQKKAFLGICLGMQLIAQDSVEHQYTEGLNWMQGNVVRLNSSSSFPVPHVGWNEVFVSNDSVLFKSIEEKTHFYFDHSYHLQCEGNLVAATCNYGAARVAAIERENIFAVQFHPEKSQRNGLKLLRNFINFVKKH